MRNWFKRIIGFVLIITAIIGLLFSIFAVAAIWYYRPIVQENITSSIELMDTTLSTTEEGLLIAETSLDSSIESIGTLETTIQATGDTISQTKPMLTTLTNLIGNDLPETVVSAQVSLEVAEESAGVIDSILTAITSIPFVPSDVYDPSVPLEDAINQVSQSLEGIPADLLIMESSLAGATDQIEIIDADIDLIAVEISEIQTSLEEATVVIDEYQALTIDLQTRLDRLNERIESSIYVLAWLLTTLVIWIGISQLGMLFQGISMLAD